MTTVDCLKVGVLAMLGKNGVECFSEFLLKNLLVFRESQSPRSRAYPSIYLSIHLSIYPSIHLSIYLSIYTSIHSSIYPFIHLSIYPSIHLFIYPPFHLSNLPLIYIPIIHLSNLLSIYQSIYLSEETALNLAVRGGHIKVVEFLTQGASEQEKDNYGKIQV